MTTSEIITDINQSHPKLSSKVTKSPNLSNSNSNSSLSDNKMDNIISHDEPPAANNIIATDAEPTGDDLSNNNHQHQHQGHDNNHESNHDPNNDNHEHNHRRPSFGLNFLSSLTNLRSNNQPPNQQTIQPPQPASLSTSPTRMFMSNSPTIGNFQLTQLGPLGQHDSRQGSADVTVVASPRDEDVNDVTIQPDVIEEDEGTPDGDSEPHEDNIDRTMVRDDPTTPATTDPSFALSPSASNNISGTNNANNQNSDTIPPSDVNEPLPDKDNGKDKDGFFSIRLTPLIDHSSSNSGLYFAPVIRKAKTQNSISIGRYTEKNKSAAHAPQGSNAPIVFKSKVVSRTHALFQCNEDGQWFIKDCKSSSGTFLNHIRLSPASQESSLMPLIDGDIIQLGMDYRGGTEEVYRCVKMRCEFNKSWQRKVNQFNLEIHKKFKNLSVKDSPSITNITGNNTKLTDSIELTDELSECAICLLKLEPCQAIFISPCSHSWHYKCIRPIIIKSYPQFYCPNCRSMCDLETDIDDDD